MNLDAVRERSQRARELRFDRPALPSAIADLRASAADVPLLIEEISNLRAALGEERAAHAQTIANAAALVASLRAQVDRVRADGDEARDEVDRLRMKYEPPLPLAPYCPSCEMRHDPPIHNEVA